MKVIKCYSLILASLLITFVFMPIVGNGWGRESEKIKVACIGDSITFGARLEIRKKIPIRRDSRNFWEENTW